MGNLSETAVDIMNNTHTSYSSHCWEPDGSFHAVCIFVISISSVCGIITIFSVYRIAHMVAAALREPENIHSTLKMYKLQTVQGSNTTLSMQSTQPKLDTIETMAAETCIVSTTGKELDGNCFCCGNSGASKKDNEDGT